VSNLKTIAVILVLFVVRDKVETKVAHAMGSVLKKGGSKMFSPFIMPYVDGDVPLGCPFSKSSFFKQSVENSSQFQGEHIHLQHCQ